MKRKAKINRVKKVANDDKWIADHFEELVNEHGGEYLVVVNGEPFIGLDAAKLFEEARRKYKGFTPTCMPIPKPEDFLSILKI